GCEVSLNGRPYVLSSGIWYEVVTEFLHRINDAAGKIASPTIGLPAWDKKESEGEYNARCAKDNAFLHFDVRNVLFGGGQSKFEFCDLFHPKGKHLYFAKIASRSSAMSHLLEQVRRTAELLFSTDPAYRNELVKVFRKHHPGASIEWLKQRPKNGEWGLCLVSLGRPAAQLPFFAKCGLVRLHKELSERGHDVTFLPV